MTDTDPQFPTAGDVRYLPVPTEHVPEVLRYIADLMTGATPMTATLTPEAPTEATPAAGGLNLTDWHEMEAQRWEDIDVVDLANRNTKTAKHYRAIMDELVDNHVGEWRSIDDIADATGLDRDVVKNFRTQIYRHLHAHTDYILAPFPGAWGADLTPRRKQVVWYRVSEAQAAQWRRVLPQLHK
ncbi:hypothetical protein [Leifsonia sp. Leaf264]|uniref:hypothetical protein n=1 Tax=Leifsonia sp. Leaf264 TaxID=1736314 RepID=UPI0006F22F91|nr:hypothetical protein [Leifsonia sp. Leaf264]KQO98422.1 hypothetical protein ASF30_10195 [Leifsonia sp. Leaf264]